MDRANFVPSDVNLGLLQGLMEAGLSDTVIAERLGINRSTVWRWRARFNADLPLESTLEVDTESNTLPWNPSDDHSSNDEIESNNSNQGIRLDEIIMNIRNKAVDSLSTYNIREESQLPTNWQDRAIDFRVLRV
uniref:Homeodomain-like domain-containing protein n=1 Tax=Trichogramma kaykai TaxID=54128 RepID=A0ABD2WKX2_9HYME